MDDGETREEMERVLRENKEIRRENQLLMKELRGIREAEEMRRRRAKEKDRERDRDRKSWDRVTRGDQLDHRRGEGGGKKEWSLRDDRYRVRSEEHRYRILPPPSSFTLLPALPLVTSPL